MVSLKPILFSTEMVMAIREGRKTQARRMLPEWCNEYSSVEIIRDPELCDPKALEWNEIKPKQCHGLYFAFDEGEEHIKCKYDIGDTLWVKETFNWDWKSYPERTDKYYFYKATTEDSYLASGEKWKPSTIMPKAACRLFLKVTDIRVERLNDISIEDCIAEGIEQEFDTYLDYLQEDRLGSFFLSPENSFKSLWSKENGKKSWDENPFVYAIKFNRIDKPENFI